MANQIDVERLKDLTHIVNTLIEGGYIFTGIQYKCISCSAHRTIVTKFRGIEIRVDSTQLECQCKGIKVKMETFAYYNNKCYQLLFD